MDQKTIDRLAVAIRAWAERQAHPDQPAIELMGMGAFSPRQLAAEVEQRSAVGLKIVSISEHGAARFGLEEILNAFKGTMAANWHGD